MPTVFLDDFEKQKLRAELQRLNPQAVDNIFFELERLESRVKQLEGGLANLWIALKPPAETTKYLPTFKK